MQKHPAAGRSQTFDQFARAPHLGTAGFIAFTLFAVGVIVAEQLHRIRFDAAAFLVAAGLTGVLFGLALYDFIINLLRIRFATVPKHDSPRPLVVESKLLNEYARWLTPLGFVVGIILGHYFWP